MLEHLDDLANAGVRSIKIEGRNKGAYYVAAVTNAYRHVLDGESPRAWMSELEATSHRPFSTGFFFGNPTQNPGHAEYARDRLLVAVAEKGERVGESWRTQVVCRNKAEVGDVLTVLSPGRPIRRFELGTVERLMPDEGWSPSPRLSVNMERYRFETPFELESGDMLCL
jgi:putative protease